MGSKKVAIISGGCGGIGKVIGKKLSEDGFDVIALYFSTPREEAEEIIKSFSPGDHEALAYDLKDEAAIAELVKNILAQRGAIDVAVHAAVGPIIRKSILELTAQELGDQFEVGFFGGFNFLKPIARAMKTQNSGTIIGLLSQASVKQDTARGRMAGYLAAKAALRGLLKELHDDLLSSSVTVNAVAPAFIDTPLNKDIPTEVKRFIAERSPEKPESANDVASTVSFLCSPEGRTENGKIFSAHKQNSFPVITQL